MSLIKLFIIGATGYFIAGLYDLSILHCKTLLVKVFYAGFFITAIPYPLLWMNYASSHSSFLQNIIIGFILLITLLLIYTVLLEIPLHTNSGKVELYTSGFYRISRHPGFLLYSTINVLIALYFWDIGVLFLCLGLIICNLLLIITEDYYLFPRMFSEYTAYKKETPFFISLHSVFRRRDQS